MSTFENIGNYEIEKSQYTLEVGKVFVEEFQKQVNDTTPINITVSSIDAFRSAIYNIAKFPKGGGYTAIKIGFTGFVALPFTAIDIFMSISEEGVLQAVVTGIGTTVSRVQKGTFAPT
ncbi:MAG: hypothetical protein K6C94_00535 [Candidatus Gastranaerophilales bacterium]|nr:hypothetical protein [Candidatus Gastranaerophilales bacterium]